jgi:alkylation response protein AidB-like acyl-CoA dehydrogenase
MRFAFTEDQELSRRSLRELLEKSCTPEMLRRAWESDTGGIPELWARLAEFGVVGLLAPESHGGMGLTEVDLVLLLEESGRAALPEPLLETAAVGIPLLAAITARSGDARASQVLEGAAAGKVVVTVGPAFNPYVAAADVADFAVLERADEAHLVPRERLELVRQPSVDHARRLFRVSFRPDLSTRVAHGKVATDAFVDASSRGALAASAELVGLGTRLVEVTIGYAKTREQFGQPIGSFQAVKHQLVDAYLALAFARPLVYRAAHSMARADPERARHVSAAKAYASDAASRAARVALQIHGAIGYSYEHDLHLWMKRVWSLAASWGDATWHRNRIASELLGEHRK